MTTYLDIQTAGRHLYPIAARDESLVSRIGKLLVRISNDMARAKSQQEIRGLSDHLLRDIGVERRTLND